MPCASVGLAIAYLWLIAVLTVVCSGSIFTVLWLHLAGDASGMVMHGGVFRAMVRCRQQPVLWWVGLQLYMGCCVLWSQLANPTFVFPCLFLHVGKPHH